jgi:cytochrome c-type biogenesis protein CcmH
MIREQLAQGATPAQIKAYFVQQYGLRVLTLPPPAGFNWVLYLLPPVIFLAALLLTVRFIRAHRGNGQNTPGSSGIDGGQNG